MRKGIWLPIALAALCVAGIVFAQSAQKESDSAHQLAQISAKLDAIVQNQAKLDTILANQDRMIQMLIIIRHR